MKMDMAVELLDRMFRRWELQACFRCITNMEKRMHELVLEEQIKLVQASALDFQTSFIVATSKVAALRQLCHTYNHMLYLNEGWDEAPAMIRNWREESMRHENRDQESQIFHHILNHDRLSKKQALKIVRNVIAAMRNRELHQAIAAWGRNADCGDLYRQVNQKSKVKGLRGLAKLRDHIIFMWENAEARRAWKAFYTGWRDAVEPELQRQAKLNKMLLQVERWRKIFVVWNAQVVRARSIELSCAVVRWSDKSNETRRTTHEAAAMKRMDLIQARFAGAEALALSTGDEALKGWRKLWDDERQELHSELSRITSLYERAVGEVNAAERAKAETRRNSSQLVAKALDVAESKVKTLMVDNRQAQTALYAQSQDRLFGGVKCLRRTIKRWADAQMRRCLWGMKMNADRHFNDEGAKVCYTQIMRQWAKQLTMAVRHVQIRQLKQLVTEWRLNRHVAVVMDTARVNHDLANSNRALLQTMYD